MAVNSLCSAFRRLAFNKQCNIITRLASSDVASFNSQRRNQPNSTFTSNALTSMRNAEVAIKFMPGSLNIDFGMPPGFNKIIETPFRHVPTMEEPLGRKPLPEDMPLSDKSLELPTVNGTFEKHAAIMIKIRRKKMQKHKRRKLRKKMRFVWEKVRIKKNLLKEKLFKQELFAKIKAAHDFDAEAYVKKRIELFTQKRLPYTWRGEILPQAQIQQFVKEKQEREEKKRNKPRLTLP